MLTLATENRVAELTRKASVIFRNVDLRGLLGLQLNTAVALKWTWTYAKMYALAGTWTYAKMYALAGSPSIADFRLWVESDSF
jgi:hypothetical protein